MHQGIKPAGEFGEACIACVCGWMLLSIATTELSVAHTYLGPQTAEIPSPTPFVPLYSLLDSVAPYGFDFLKVQAAIS